MQTLPLSALRDGHDYPGESINCRVTEPDAEIAQLAASIRVEGLLQSLLVCPDPERPGSHYVIDGNRRLTAMRELAEGGAIDKDYPVDCIVADDITTLDALRKSLAANELQLPMHPVDRHEAFAKIHAAGASPADIGAQFGISNRAVKKTLALGRLSPEIRRAWRAGEIDTETAQAFTLGATWKEQESAFAKMKKRGKLDAASVRAALVGDQSKSTALLSFVGQDAYVAAGGALPEDLFDQDQPIVTDHKLVAKLAEKKLAGEITYLTGEEGWSWAAADTDLPSAHPSWEEMPRTGAGGPPEKKRRQSSGCILSISANGELSVRYAVIKPDFKVPPKKEKKDRAKKSEPEQAEADLPAPLTKSLKLQLTKAVADAMQEEDAAVALSALIAGFLSYANGPVKVSMHGHAENEAPEDFAATFTRILKMNNAKRMDIMARLAARALDLSGADVEKTLISAIGQQHIRAAMKRHFDAPAYFSQAPKPLILRAIEEIHGKKAARPNAGKKTDLAKIATHDAVKKGWLPPELRTVHYNGPGAA